MELCDSGEEINPVLIFDINNFNKSLTTSNNLGYEDYLFVKERFRISDEAYKGMRFISNNNLPSLYKMFKLV